MNVPKSSLLFFALLIFALSSNTLAQIDPLNPPLTATHPDTPGTWVLVTGTTPGVSGDLRGYAYGDGDPRGPVFADWIKSQSYFPWLTTYYLKIKVTATYNRLASGNVDYSVVARDTGVLGPFVVSIERYGPPTQTFSYPRTLGHPPQPGTIGLLETDQMWWLRLGAKIPSLQWNYYTGSWEFSGYYYDWDVSVTPTTAISKWHYQYQP